MTEKSDSYHIDYLNGFLGDGRLLTGDGAKEGINKPWRYGEKNHNFLAVVQAADEKEMAAVLRYCSKEGINIVPRAGGTALTNGSTIDKSRPDGKYIILQNIARKKTDIIDEDGQAYAIIGAGTTARDIEKDSDYIVPVDLGIGSKGGKDRDGEDRCAELLGYLATNAAGSGAAFKGRALDMVESMKVMTLDGKIWELPSRSPDAPKIKEIIGFGGTTGMILEAKIKLIEKPKQRAVAALRVDDISQMYDILEACKAEGWDDMNLFERVNTELFETVITHHKRENAPETEQLRSSGKGDYLFIETNSTTEKLAQILNKAGLAERAIFPEPERMDFVLGYRVVNASTSCDRYARENGGKVVAFDISVPNGDAGEFPSDELIERIKDKIPNIKIFAFGHAAGVEKIEADSARGGTALHFNPVLPKGSEKLEGWLREQVFEEVAKRGGQIVSEHTVGTKLVRYSKQHMPEAYDATLATIARWNPQGILNAGAFCEKSDVLAKAEEIARDGK